LLGSCRKQGNSEILAKEALMAAEAAGAEVELLRLTEYQIAPCEGSGVCLFRKEGCYVEDELALIWSRIAEADAILLTVPCYFLESTAVIKQMIDRAWELAHRGTYRGKHASVIVPYATRGWIPYAFLQPNILFAILGFHVIHRAAVQAQGLREVVHDDEAIAKAHNIGRELTEAAANQDPAYRSEPGLCPICQDWNIRILKDRRTVECPTCGVRGRLTLEDGRIDVEFDEEALAEYRFDVGVAYNHFTYHIKPSRDYYVRTREERKAKAEPYRYYMSDQE
jgi:multimeric flavodoxin WrbA